MHLNTIAIKHGFVVLIRLPLTMWLNPEEVLLKNALNLWVTEKSNAYFLLQRRRGHGDSGGKITGLLVGALDTVLDSNARVTPFRILLQVPGSQVSWVIASGTAVEEVNRHWDWLVQNLLHSLSVFENKDDVTSFVNGKVKGLIAEELRSRQAAQEDDPEKFREAVVKAESPGRAALPEHQPPAFYSFLLGKEVKVVIPWAEVTRLDRTSTSFMTDTVCVTTRRRQRHFSMFLSVEDAFGMMVRLADITLRRLLDNEAFELDQDLQQPINITKRVLEQPVSEGVRPGVVWAPRHTYLCFTSREEGLCSLLIPLSEVISIEKPESTCSLPNPVIVSVRSKRAFQLIELRQREELVDSLTNRLRALQWKRAVFHNKEPRRKPKGQPAALLHLLLRHRVLGWRGGGVSRNGGRWKVLKERLWEEHFSEFGRGVHMFRTEKIQKLVAMGIPESLRGGPVDDCLRYYLGGDCTPRLLRIPEPGRNLCSGRVLTAYAPRNPKIGYCQKFRDLTVLQVERLRCRHRIQVLQAHEDTAKENTLRVVTPDLSLSPEDLADVYDLFKTEYFINLYWGEGVGGAEARTLRHHDPSRPYTEQYQVDRPQFKSLYQLLAPWLCGVHTDTVADRTFSLLHQQQDSFINFRQFAGWLDTLYCGELNEKIRLLYQLHIPPAFTENEDDPSPLKTPLLSTTRPLYMEYPNGGTKDYQEQLKQMLKDLANEKEENVEKPLPMMTQREFIQFCKTLYSMFHEDPEENELFQAIATVTSLVLQIGEVEHRSRCSSEEEGGAVAPEEPPLSGISGQRSEWTVSFAQILASLLTEQSLVNFFEKPTDLRIKIALARERQYHERVGLLEMQHGPG
ncbi:hypothetical protein SKAU_G00427300 [Synaphobranchus kaupii]|uniref:GRAM domain-containing protein n=1 Tax=Synaphobranchus kaupii TaxID=118154 RepID=A0A9Q1E4Y5_SYNKA|nr:hypothetical protein SKAU_G00427300 [Synaphobranchus kaupii]